MRVLITGATSGIGRATAIIFASHGHDLVLTGRRQDRLQNLANSLGMKHEVDIETLCFDVWEVEACEAVMAY